MDDRTPPPSEDRNRPDRDDASRDLPASMIFSELVRQAAARRAAERSATDADAGVPPPADLPRFFDDDAPLPPPVDRPPSAPRRPPSEPRKPQPPPVSPPKQAESQTPAPRQDIVPGQRILVSEPQMPAPVYAQPAARPLTDEERVQAAALEAERIRRVKKRQAARQARRVGVLGGVIRALLVTSFAAGLMATILSWFTSADFLSPDVRRNIAQVVYADHPTPTPTIAPTPNWARTIGIVSGHRGPGQEASYDPGAVCDDGLTENEINFAVASQVVLALRQRGYSVLLLDEFDPRLTDFQGAALVSIHSNTCAQYDEVVSGFLVAKAEAKPPGGPDDRLAECIAALYGAVSGLERRYGTTVHMTNYHSFREIHPLTPAAIIELGFMRADRDSLVNRQDVLSRGVVEGVLCFLEPDNLFGIIPATPVPTATALPDA
ncbi:MAG: N-acetylmuramoyl-L-alanine amidase [Chloroflexi bacterium]|nr:N-acetylmuramoyl-L-alanine amidase [Chloroflexota bacterium]